MVKSCYLCGCKQDSDGNISLHIFPKDNWTISQWFRVCGLSEDTDQVTKSVVICSKHFKSEDFWPQKIRLGKKINVLKPGAIPSVSIPYPDRLQRRTGTPISLVMTPPIRTQSLDVITPNLQFSTLEETSTCNPVMTSEEDKSIEDIPVVVGPEVTIMQEEYCELVLPVTPKKRKFGEPRYIGDISTPDVATPTKARKVISMVKRTDMEKSRKIKNLQDANRCLKNRLSTLKDLVQQLQENGFMNEEARDILMVHL